MAGGLDLLYDFTQLDTCSGNLNNVLENVFQIKQDINALMDKTSDFWEGDAQKAYAERCGAILRNLEKLHSEVEKNRNKLITAIGKYRQNEDTQKSKVSALSDEDIF